VPFLGGAEREEHWPAFEEAFYWDELNRVWVYKYTQERIIAAIRSDEA